MSSKEVKKMKKVISFFILIVVLNLCGCSLIPSMRLNSNNVETMKGWSFQYNEGTNDYSLFFGLLNEKEQYISAEVDVDIRIEDESGNELFNGTQSVSKSDFASYTNSIAGEQYLANVRIKASEIAEGTSSNGTVYLKVYKDSSLSFDEVTCKALNCLPIKDISLQAEDLPIELSVKGFDGSVESKIRVDDVTYTFDKSIAPQLNVTLFGTKTYGGNSSYDIISYKLYDSSGNVVKTGDVYLSALDSGDKFKNDSITIYDIIPGEKYILKFYEYSL